VQSQGTLIIGETALVRAEIQAGVVLIRGEIHGKIEAKSRIEAYAPAKIFANLFSPVLVFGEGTIFQGSSHMTAMDEPASIEKEFPDGSAERGS